MMNVLTVFILCSTALSQWQISHREQSSLSLSFLYLRSLILCMGSSKCNAAAYNHQEVIYPLPQVPSVQLPNPGLLERVVERRLSDAAGCWVEQQKRDAQPLQRNIDIFKPNIHEFNQSIADNGKHSEHSLYKWPILYIYSQIPNKQYLMSLRSPQIYSYKKSM